MKRKLLYAVAAPALLASASAHAADSKDLQAILKEVREMKQAYESRIQSLEGQIKALSQKQTKAQAKQAPASGGTRVKGYPLLRTILTQNIGQRVYLSVKEVRGRPSA